MGKALVPVGPTLFGHLGHPTGNHHLAPAQVVSNQNSIEMETGSVSTLIQHCCQCQVSGCHYRQCGHHIWWQPDLNECQIKGYLHAMTLTSKKRNTKKSWKTLDVNIVKSLIDHEFRLQQSAWTLLHTKISKSINFMLWPSSKELVTKKNTIILQSKFVLF